MTRQIHRLGTTSAFGSLHVPLDAFKGLLAWLGAPWVKWILVASQANCVGLSGISDTKRKSWMTRIEAEHGNAYSGSLLCCKSPDIRSVEGEIWTSMNSPELEFRSVNLRIWL